MRTLSNEESYSYPRKIEPIQPCLHIQSNVLRILTALPLQYTLCNGRNCWIVSALDMVKQFRESFIVVLNFRWPSNVIGIGIVSVQIPQKRGDDGVMKPTFVPSAHAASTC